jgi:cytochrome c'
VESAAVALAESVDLILKPGRLCSNGRPVPVDRADFRKFAQGLRAAGQAALKAAQSKNMDNMVEVSGTVSEACENCHSVYRDKPDLKNRCIP